MPYVARLGNTAFALWLGQATWRIAGLLTMHLFGLTLLLGSIVMSSLHLVGVFDRHPSPGLRRDITRGALIGMAVVLTSGLLIFTGGAEAYFMGYWFRLKMVLLALALLFHFTIYRLVTSESRRFSPPTKAFTAAVSLALWFGVACAGRAIAFF